jgi:hypothetical protein
MNITSTQGRSPWSNHLLSFLLAASAALALYYIGFECLLVHWQGDQAWLLYAAKLVLAGVPLDGNRLIEVNPPLIVWFSTIPAALAKALHVSPLLAMKINVLAMIAGSAAWCVRILRAADLKLQPGVLLFLATAIALVELTIQPAEFAQREQIIVALLLPYILAVTSGAVQRLPFLECCALGVAAGLGVCVKPQQLLPFLCLELFLAVSTRSARRLLRPELLASVMTGVGYVIAVRLFSPYFQQIVPILKDTYWALGEYTFQGMVMHKGIGSLVLMLMAAVVWWRTRRSASMSMVSGALLMCSFGASLAWNLQHTGWGYQMFPERAFLALGILWIVIDLCSVKMPRVFEQVSVPTWLWILSILLSVTALGATAKYRTHQKSQRAAADTMVNVLTRYPAHTRISIFSVSMVHLSTVVDRDLVWSSRFASLWMLPAIVENQFGRLDTSRPFKALPPERVDELSALLRKETTEDLQFWKPEVVFVERCPSEHSCSALERSFDFMGWFLQSPEFAREWSKYHKQGTVEAYDVYTRDAQP